MKYLTGLMLLLLVQVASATECRLNGGSWVDPETKGFNAYVDVKANLVTGKVLLDGYTLECRHGILSTLRPSEDIVTYTNAVRLSPAYSHLEAGMRVLGVDYPIPVRGGILLSRQTTEPLVSVSGRPYLKIVSAPGKYIQIKSGALIASIYLEVRTYSFGTLLKRFTMFVNVYARNALNLNPASCTINNNAPINVDFGSVDPLAIGESHAGAPNQKTFILLYSCPDAGITTPINITLKATRSAFNSNGIVLSNPDLATVVYRVVPSAVLPPGGSFSSSITNSMGRDAFTFALIRKPGSLPAAGPFTGSATLVMSVP